MADEPVIPPLDVKVSTTESKSKQDIPPLFSFQITNPVTYLKKWWKQLIGTDGIKVTLQVKPLTAFMLTCIITGVGFGAGRMTIPEPLVRYIPIIPSPMPSPSPNPWKETAYTGKVQFSGNQYFLVTSAAEAIKLTVNPKIDLKPLIGKRIMVVGLFDKVEKVMIVTDTSSLEVLTASPVPIPTVKPSPSPTL